MPIGICFGAPAESCKGLPDPRSHDESGVAEPSISSTDLLSALLKSGPNASLVGVSSQKKISL